MNFTTRRVLSGTRFVNFLTGMRIWNPHRYRLISVGFWWPDGTQDSGLETTKKGRISFDIIKLCFVLLSSVQAIYNIITSFRINLTPKKKNPGQRTCIDIEIPHIPTIVSNKDGNNLRKFCIFFSFLFTFIDKEKRLLSYPFKSFFLGGGEEMSFSLF